jgi:hypothetical protein
LLSPASAVDCCRFHPLLPPTVGKEKIPCRYRPPRPSSAAAAICCCRCHRRPKKIQLSSVTLGATLTTNEVARGISLGGRVFMHGPTFMANPLACSVLLASVNLLMLSPWEERVRGVEGRLIEHLSPLTKLKSHRSYSVFILQHIMTTY